MRKNIIVIASESMSLRIPRSGMKQPHSGVSLLTAIIFVSFFLLAIVGLTAAKLAVTRSIGNRENEAKAASLAETVEELATFMAGTSSLGWNFHPTAEEITLPPPGVDVSTLPDAQKVFRKLVDLAIKMGITGCEVKDTTTNMPKCAWMRVIGSTDEEQAKLSFADTSSSISVWNSVPPAFKDPVYVSGVEIPMVRGTGDMAVDCGNDEDWAKDADNPCHWNKLKFGESAEVPLYAPDPAEPTSPLKATKFRVRIRTPKCTDLDGAETDGTDCEPNYETGRVVLYPPVDGVDFLDLEKDKVLVQWMIVDEDGGETLVASEETVMDLVGNKNKRPANVSEVGFNTEVTAGRINEAFSSSGRISNFDVLNQGQKAKDINGDVCSGFCARILDFIGNSLKITKPVLRLSLVDKPYRNDARDEHKQVPYLEYQVLADNPIMSTESAYSVWAQVGDFKKEATGKYRHPMTVGGFAIEN